MDGWMYRWMYEMGHALKEDLYTLVLIYNIHAVHINKPIGMYYFIYIYDLYTHMILCMLYACIYICMGRKQTLGISNNDTNDT